MSISTTNKTQNIDDLIVGTSNWKERAEQRKINKPWLKKSQAIAFMVLDALKSKKMTQVQLAEKLGVSPQQINKIVKGHENLTLETISKLENALGIQLFVIPEKLIDTTSATSSENLEFNPITKRDLIVSESTDSKK